MTGTFYLKCMGLPELRSPDGRVVRMRGRKHLALLIYLAVERRSQYSRDELAHLLWADAPTPEARHSLATAASAIRRALGPDALEGNRELLRLRHARLRLDVDRLESGELFATPELPAIEVDSFLQGFDIRDAQEYMQWRDRQHARWLPPIHAALLRLIDHARRTGASRVTGSLADKLLEIDELSEDGIRAKMEALAFTGDRIAALRVFEVWRERFAAELDATPSALLEEMARRLRRRGLERPVADPAPSVQTDPWRDRPFVGRATEYQQLYEAWESSLKHAPRHVLVEGESGIGKSTLVERFAMAAALEGAIVSRVQCYELERAIPFAAVAALVTGLLDKPGVAATDPAALAEVARVVPKVRERFPGLPAPRDSQGETARLHFAEGILAMLEAAMEEHPVILIVDDFHLADEVSLTVLHLLIRRLESVRLVVLLLMRTAELRVASAAARIHGGGEYLRMTRLTLPPLSESESAELLAGLVPKDRDPPNPPERHALLQAARGVPMVLQLLVQDWQRHGSASLALAIRSMTARIGAGGAENSEGAYRHIVDRVLGELDPGTRLVLQAATVFGSRINDLTLYQVADLTTSQVMMGMAELTERHILRDSPTGLDFVNELVRSQAYSAMPGALRQALHGAVARQLLMRLASQEEAVRGLETAWHLVRGGRAPEAAPHLLRGAREAISEGAPHEAELALGSALREADLLRGEDRISGILLHAQVLQELSMWKRSREVAEPLLTARPRAIADHAEVLIHLADHRLRVPDGHPPGRVKRLLAIAQNSADLRVCAGAAANAATLAEELQVVDDYPELRLLLQTVRGDTGAPEAQVDLLSARATLNYDAGRFDESISDVRAALAILETARIANASHANLINGLSALHCALGDYPEAERLAALAFRLSGRLDNEYIARKSASNASVAAGRQGQYLEQERWGRLSLGVEVRPDLGSSHMRAALYVAEARAMRWERDALTVYRQLIDQMPRDLPPWELQACLLNEADLHQLLGNKKHALEIGRHATTGQNQEPLSRGWTGKFARWLTLTSLASNDSDTAYHRISDLARSLKKFDAIDRIEIACCLSALSSTWSQELEAITQEAWNLLAKMPPAVADRLERLAMLAHLRRSAITKSSHIR